MDKDEFEKILNQKTTESLFADVWKKAIIELESLVKIGKENHDPTQTCWNDGYVQGFHEAESALKIMQKAQL